MKRLLSVFLLFGLATASFFLVIHLTDKKGTQTAFPKPSSIMASSKLLEKENNSSKPVSFKTEKKTNNDINGEGKNNPLPSADVFFGKAIGGSFDLIDHFGNARQLEDYQGKHVMIFFGYANCLAICTAALPLMADVLDLIDEQGQNNLIPLMITVDPENDTPDFMRQKLAEYHPRLIGMTGSDGALEDVRRKFQIKTEYIGEDIAGNPIYNHGSFIYLLGPDGKFQTLVPPILAPQQMAKIIKKYIAKSGEKQS